MQLFLSWSGSRSKALAEAFAGWIAQVIQAVEPWLSQDIEKGARWSAEISSRLEKSKIGIVCLTQENLNSPWVLFEAGAISKTPDAHVCTLLLPPLTNSDIELPLGQFQNTVANKSDVFRLVQTINGAVKKLGEKSLSDGHLSDVFETYWNRLEARMNHIAGEAAARPAPRRDPSEILDEVLQAVRTQDKKLDEIRSEVAYRFERQTPGIFWAPSSDQAAAQIWGSNQANLPTLREIVLNVEKLKPGGQVRAELLKAESTSEKPEPKKE